MNILTSSKISKIIFLILLGLIFLSHLPFIEADPDRNMSVGRGPFTDEGLNTIQARNWVNHGNLDLAECDNFLKTPLLGFPLTVTYKIFGISHVISRLHVLVLVFLGLALLGMDPKNRGGMILFALITMLQYPVFHSSHFSMAEMLSVMSIIMSIHFLNRSLYVIYSYSKKLLYAILSGIFLSLSYYFKIQFIYIIALPPLVLTLLYFTSSQFLRRIIIRHGLAITATLLAFLLLYLLAWYLPNKDAYDYMMAHQSGEFTLSGKIWEYIRFNINYHLLNGWTQWFVYFFLILTAAGFFMLKQSQSSRYPVLFSSSLVWFLLETHKLTMAYLPTRYQVSFYAAMGLLMSVVIFEVLITVQGKWKLTINTIITAMLLIIVSINAWLYFDALHNRTYTIRNTSNYLSGILEKKDIALGAWAPSLTWDSGSKALPVWNNFLNYEDPVRKHHPRVIIAETDEQDSEQAWLEQGINLTALADSIKTVDIGKWKIGVYWLKIED